MPRRRRHAPRRGSLSDDATSNSCASAARVGARCGLPACGGRRSVVVARIASKRSQPHCPSSVSAFPDGHHATAPRAPRTENRRSSSLMIRGRLRSHPHLRGPGSGVAQILRFRVPAKPASCPRSRHGSGAGSRCDDASGPIVQHVRREMRIDAPSLDVAYRAAAALLAPSTRADEPTKHERSAQSRGIWLAFRAIGKLGAILIARRCRLSGGHPRAPRSKARTKTTDGADHRSHGPVPRAGDVQLDRALAHRAISGLRLTARCTLGRDGARRVSASSV